MDGGWHSAISACLLNYWLLHTIWDGVKECPYARHTLVEALLARQEGSWEAHLFEVAQAELERHPQKDQEYLRLKVLMKYER